MENLSWEVIVILDSDGKFLQVMGRYQFAVWAHDNGISIVQNPNPLFNDGTLSNGEKFIHMTVGR